MIAKARGLVGLSRLERLALIKERHNRVILNSRVEEADDEFDADFDDDTMDEIDIDHEESDVDYEAN